MTFPIYQYTLRNGLRVVLAPDRMVPVVGISVVYDVGFRSEAENNAGFAHLFEHLMFEGSANVRKLEHFRLVQGAGGTANGVTHLDYTEFFELLPANGLELGLFLEADRMRSPVITAAEIANQVDVIAAEIRSKVLSRPYGGFPAAKVPPVLFSSFHNSHDGYGGIGELRAASVAAVARFFRTYYSPRNAVMAVAGDFDCSAAVRLIDRYFAGIAATPAPRRPDFTEPPLPADRHTSYTDPLAPLPAFAVAWRVPDPITDRAAYLPYLVLNAALTDGAFSRLAGRLVAGQRIATDVAGRLGAGNEPFTARNPSCLILWGLLLPQASADAALGAIDAELCRIAEDGLAPDELDRVRARLTATLLADLDRVQDRVRRLAVTTCLHGDARAAVMLAAGIGEVTSDQVAAVAASMRASSRAVVEVIPGGGP